MIHRSRFPTSRVFEILEIRCHSLAESTLVRVQDCGLEILFLEVLESYKGSLNIKTFDVDGLPILKNAQDLRTGRAQTSCGVLAHYTLLGCPVPMINKSLTCGFHHPTSSQATVRSTMLGFVLDSCRIVSKYTGHVNSGP